MAREGVIIVIAVYPTLVRVHDQCKIAVRIGGSTGAEG
jgi:hypothetical protein